MVANCLLNGMILPSSQKSSFSVFGDLLEVVALTRWHLVLLNQQKQILRGKSCRMSLHAADCHWRRKSVCRDLSNGNMKGEMKMKRQRKRRIINDG